MIEVGGGGVGGGEWVREFVIDKERRVEWIRKI